MIPKRKCGITKYIIPPKNKEALKWLAEKKQKVQVNMERK